MKNFRNALARARKFHNESRFVATLCRSLWTTEELGERCLKQTKKCNRRCSSPPKLKAIRKEYKIWINEKYNNKAIVDKELRRLTIYLSRVIYAARKCKFM